MKDDYEINKLKGLLHTKWAGRQLFFYESIDSTNKQASRLAGANVVHGTLVVADAQTAGKGRHGRSWESPEDKNLYFTIILKPDFEQAKAAMITLVTAYAVAEGMKKTFAQENATLAQDKKPWIKWPNDIIIGEKKVCGILTELNINAKDPKDWHILVGVGVNVKDQDFPEEIIGKATSICGETGVTLSRSKLLADILEVFEESYEEFMRKGDLSSFQDAYNEILVNRNREVCVLDPKGEYTGVAKGITNTGELLIERTDGTVTEVYAGEVSVRGIYGYV